MHNLAMLDPAAQAPPIPQRNPARSPVAKQPNLPRSYSSPSRASVRPLHRNHSGDSVPQSPQRSQSPGSPVTQALRAPGTAPVSPSGAMSPSRASTHARNRTSEISSGASPLRYSSSSYTTSDAGTSFAGWPSPGSTQERTHKPLEASSSKKAAPFPQTPQEIELSPRANSKPLPLLPAPDLTRSMPYESDANTKGNSRSHVGFRPASQPTITRLHPSSSIANQNADFEKEAFRNSAILCDV